MDTADSYETVP